MATKSDARCIIRVNGLPRTLFSVSERKPSGDLVIRIKTGTFYGVGELTEKIQEQRYSVHVSNDSRSGINAIKQTILLDSGRAIITRQYTKAMKRGNRFAALFTSLVPDLSPDKYLTDTSPRSVIDLGSYDPDAFVLIYMLVISNRDREFSAPPGFQANITHIEFSEFRITVLWSFAIGPSASFGWKRHALTIPPEYFSAIAEGAIDESDLGYDEALCAAIYAGERQILFGSMTNQILSIMEPKHHRATLAIARLGFFMMGTKGSIEFLSRLQDLATKGEITLDDIARAK